MPAPLLLLLHGSGRDAASIFDPWQSLAKKERIVLVAPDSLNRAGWNGTADRSVPVEAARSTLNTLKAAGFPVLLTEGVGFNQELRVGGDDYDAASGAGASAAAGGGT